ncbi:spermatogenesis-associated protein 45 [Eublepharis macularius]|uniref:Spermatogenesis-associated protein 45 n=1 Tax=Eublepharis macularius TaxID=481883 RepID=A0AA97LKM9_EUBMA|nr:spermatogenesis-associated protein 45 [Eublepharis macularius]
MTAEDKKLLLEYNKLRETKCLLEGKSETSWLRPQRRHFPQSNRSSIEKVREEKQEFNSGRTSWITINPPHHKERRHFPERNNAIFG